MLADYSFVWFQGSVQPFATPPNRNLTYLANVRQWVGSSTATDDALLNRLISEASRTILNYLQTSDIGLTTITEIISGRGERKLQLRNWPVIEVTGLSVNGVAIPASTGPTSYGYFLEPVYGSLSGRAQNLGIVGSGGGGIFVGPGYSGFSPNSHGRGFPRGIGNIAVTYSYGYCIQGESQTIGTSPYEVLPYASYGSWSGDLGVTYANGTALTPVVANPGAGQYVPPNLVGDSPILYYQFSSADAGRRVVLNYNFIPYDLEQACIEVTAERYRYKSRIGQISQTLGGQETAAYFIKDMLTPAIQGRLDPYRLSWLG